MSFRDTVRALQAAEAVIEELVDTTERRLKEKNDFLGQLKEIHAEVLAELTDYCPECAADVEVIISTREEYGDTFELETPVCPECGWRGAV